MASLLVALVVWLAPSSAWAEDGKSGLSPNRVKLPQGPGSLEGIGENAEPNLNMGIVSYGVPISLPGGYHGFSPDLRLSYSSAGGASVVGMGWSLGVPSIERMTARGLPDYDADDLMAAGGGEELVRVPGTTIFRARYESGFVRYHWLDAPEGHGGYWKAEYPDGRIGYFGADAEGKTVDSARVETSAGTFRYMLVEMVDRFGHRIRYVYDKPQIDGRPYLERIDWALSGGQPRYSVQLEYEARDDNLSDAKSGMEVRLSRRLKNVRVNVRQRLLRRYRLDYEPYSQTGGLTRLAGVRTFGSNDRDAHPVEFEFSYTGDFDPACDGSTGTSDSASSNSCGSPYVQNVGSVGVDFAAGHADLIDLNRDHLPDVIDTREGQHRIFLQTIDGAGQRFTEPHSSNTAGSGAMQLSSPSVHMVDLDGNGSADMLDGLNAAVLFNEGGGDWGRSGSNDPRLPDFAGDQNLRFLDVDYDHFVDCVHIDPSGAWYYRNLQNGRFSSEATLLDLSGIGFVEDGLQLADANGDGMLDLVQPLSGGWAYRLNLGHGRFAEPREMLGLPDGWQPQDVKWVDLNGDSLADAVMVLGNEVRYALNRNGRDFGEVVGITQPTGGLPERTPETSVRFADMNGSGSTDVVWISASGQVRYLELFPRRQHLLSRIENGIGKIIELYYGTSTEHMARDGGPDAWDHHVPHVMITLDRMDTYDSLSGVRQIQSFRYSDGYYDGGEHQFRGFAHVEAQSDGDTTSETGITLHDFDVGSSDPYRKGLLLRKETLSAGRSIQATTHEYGDCPVAEVPADTNLPVRHLCQVATTQEQREGRPASEWVRLRTETEYDGYGNDVLTRSLGVVSIGDGGCGTCSGDSDQLHGQPCGGSCLGDEAYSEKHCIEPGAQTDGRWLVGLPYQELRYGIAGAPKQPNGTYWEQRTYYDGPAFEGLPGGTATLGSVTRKTHKVDHERVIAAERYQYDAHGNVLAALDPNDHRREFGYDQEGLLLLHEDAIFDDPGHAPYRLRQALSHDPLFEQPIASTAWMRVEGTSVFSAPRLTLYEYDQYGRLTKVARPGDDLQKPTSEFFYELTSPVSRIVQRTRSATGGSYDLQSIQCFDGLGRKLQTREQLESGLYQVSGFSEFNAQGGEHRSLQPYQSSAGSCATRAPESVLASERIFDALGRAVEEQRPDASVYGQATRLQTEYRPLKTLLFDGEDTNSSSPYAGTPTTTAVDGQGRTTHIERLLEASGDPVVTSFRYDTLGHLSYVADDAGNVKQQQHDLLGRPTEIDDPDAGVIYHEYDDAGNVLRSIDARGVTVVTEYDEASRPVRQYDPADPEGSLNEWFYDGFAGCDANDCRFPEGQLVAVRYQLPEGERGEDHFGFDERGRQVFRSRALANFEFRFANEYDNADRLVATAYPTGQRIETDLDGLSRPVSVPGYVDRVGYSERGLTKDMLLANGVQSEFGYDSVLRLTSLEARHRGTLLQGYGYQRDRADNIVAISDDRDPARSPTANAEYSYDALYRLTHAELEPDHEDRAESLDIVYDTIDNIDGKFSSRERASAAHVGDYTYSEHDAGPHAVTRAGHKSYRYDASGNQILRHQHDLHWDHLERLSEVTHRHRLLGRFGYTPDGQRVVKQQGANQTLYVTSDFEVRDGVSTLYISAPTGKVVKIDDASLADEILGDSSADDAADGWSDSDGSAGSDGWSGGQITAADAYRRFHEGGGSAEADAAAAERAQQAERKLASSARQILLDDGNRTTYLHRDHLGSAAVTTDQDGKVVQQTEHYPYGSIRAQTQYLEDYSYTGQERDRFTDLSYHSARYLDPQLGRWTAADPLFVGASTQCLKSPGECNGYGYALGSPVGFSDPSGMITTGEFIDQKGMAAAGRGNKVATFGWAFASAGWNVFGAESLSKVSDSFISGRDDVTGGDFGFAALEAGIVTKGAKWAGKAGQGIWKGAKGLGEKFKSWRGGGSSAGGGTAASGLSSWNDFQRATRGKFESRAEAAAGWRVYKQANRTDNVLVIGRLPDTEAAAAKGFQRLNDPGWSPAVNDAWVQGAIDAGRPFKLVSPITKTTLKSPAGSRFPDTIFRRELHQLRDAGYTIRDGWAKPPNK